MASQNMWPLVPMYESQAQQDRFADKLKSQEDPESAESAMIGGGYDDTRVLPNPLADAWLGMFNAATKGKGKLGIAPGTDPSLVGTMGTADPYGGLDPNDPTPLAQQMALKGLKGRR